MLVLVIPDIHLKTWIFDRAEKILRDGKADRAVCLMDIPDDWNMEFQIERYKETFDRAIVFAVDYPDTLWCYGNHDVSYPWGRLETGYSPYAERTVMSKLEELESSLKSLAQIGIIHRIDNVLFSHGGITADFLKWLDEDLLDADIDDVSILLKIGVCVILKQRAVMIMSWSLDFGYKSWMLYPAPLFTERWSLL